MAKHLNTQDHSFENSIKRIKNKILSYFSNLWIFKTIIGCKSNQG